MKIAIILVFFCLNTYGQKSTEWTVETLKEHFDALRAADQRAIQIKEEGDSRALELAREIQTYKDEQHNGLKEQINQERNLYVKIDRMKPIEEYIASQQGRNKGLSDYYGYILAGIVAALAIWDRNRDKSKV